jgi:phosphoribosylformylglycinamidine synthase
MESVHRFADAGGLVLGICNGFQILLESGLLPGAMLRNRSLKFICDTVRIRTERTDTPFTRRCSEGLVLRLPIAHAEGRYFADPSALRRLEDRRQVVFRYCGPDGEPGEGSNPNGSLNAIAGICNEKGNVLGLMPHPERMSEEVLGGKDGLLIFESMMESVLRGVAG